MIRYAVFLEYQTITHNKINNNDNNDNNDNNNDFPVRKVIAGV